MPRKWPLFKGFERNHYSQNETQTIIDHFWSKQSIYSIKEESLLNFYFIKYQLEKRSQSSGPSYIVKSDTPTQNVGEDFYKGVSPKVYPSKLINQERLRFSS